MTVKAEIKEKMEKLPITVVCLLYLASKYPDWVYYKEIAEFVSDVKGCDDRIVINELKQYVYKRKRLAYYKSYGKKAIFYKIREKGLKWLRYKMLVEGEIPVELKVPAIDLVRVKVGGREI